MKTITTYQCEVCGTAYEDKEVAEHGETFMPLAESPIRVGDTVYCESRYDGFFELKVTGVTTQATRLQRRATLEKVVYKKGRYAGQELTDLDYAKLENLQPHEWVYTTNEELMVCKDGECSDQWSAGELYFVKDWVFVLSLMPEECLIKYIDNGETFILRGGMTRFLEHWVGKVEFVAWGVYVTGDKK
jgi:hypothetical protein